MRPSFFVFMQIYLLLFSENSISDGAETILPGQVLSINDTISSKGGIFELGFFTPGKSQKYYIGIWYKQIQEKTVIWVANRESPLSDKHSMELKMNKDGNLVLNDQVKRQVWSTNVSSIPSNRTTAELLDTGNLVIRDGVLNSSATVWQSFDHPTDSAIPKQRLGKNKATGERQRMTSWKNSEDPAPGMYSLEMDPRGINQLVLLWNRSIVYSESGAWTGHFFTRIPIANSAPGFKTIFVDTQYMSYFFYDYSGSILTRTYIDPSGQYKVCMWLKPSEEWSCFWTLPTSRCDVYSYCNSFGICTQPEFASAFCSCPKGFEPTSPKDWNSGLWSGGCKRRMNLKCTGNRSIDENEDGFLELSNIELPANSQSLVNQSANECRFSCLRNCLCTAYTYNNGCYVWYGDLINLKRMSNNKTKGEGLFLRLDATELQVIEEGKKRFPLVVVLVIVSSIVFAFGITLLLIWVFHRNRQLLLLKNVEGPLVPLRYKYLKSITKNFSEKLGAGGFGSVFKGKFPNSTMVAVKKLEGLRQGEKQFKAEISIIGKIQHINLIRLRAFCSEGTNRLLVYDYMPNGSLDHHLFHKDALTMNWETRYQIALGIAKGLSYLHEKCRDFIIHCDIKPENVLLDATFCPKVADFGMSKLFDRDFSRVLTSMRGTIGYLAPEWISGVAITPKVDVYSYGMMLLEIISGKRNSEQLGDDEFVFFPCWASRKLNECNVIALLDARLNGDANIEELSRASNVAFWCIQDDESDRPTMGLVVQILEGAINISKPPIPKFIQTINHGKM